MLALRAMLRAVLFDLGNTLHHVDHEWIAACLGRHGHVATPRDVAVAEYAAKAEVDALFRARRAGTDAARHAPYIETTLRTLGVDATIRSAVEAAIRDENTRDSIWRVQRPDTKNVLAALRARGLVLGVISNADGRVAAALARSGIADAFATIVDSHHVGVEKPDPRIFRIALDACRVAPEESLFVGDLYEIDVVGARAAGIEAVLLDPLGRYGPVDCARIAELRDLLAIVDARLS